MSSTILVLFVILPLTLSQRQYYYVYDKMSYEDKDKIRKLAHELIVEAKYKVNQVDGIRDTLSTETGFQVGMVVGQIREKYKTMLELFRQTKNKYDNKANIIMPSVEKRLPIHYFVRMEMIHGLETDIDRLIHVLETIPEYRHNLPSLVPKRNS